MKVDEKVLEVVGSDGTDFFLILVSACSTRFRSNPAEDETRLEDFYGLLQSGSHGIHYNNKKTY